MKSVRKATNLYRRVSTVSYRHIPDDTNKDRSGGAKHRKHTGSKCLVCRVTLVKSSKDKRRAGVKLRCPCNVRVCSMCLEDNPNWYLSQPHFGSCSVISRFICYSCSLFHSVAERQCCVWLCSECSSRSRGDLCSVCSRKPNADERRETCTLWPRTRSVGGSGPAVADSQRVCDVTKVQCYKQELRARVLSKVADARHLTPADIQVLFHETYEDVKPCGVCQADTKSALCTSCTPVLTIMELLAKNPKPLMASLAERAVPGRALVRHVYNRETLSRMLNDRRLPFCVNAQHCKGMLMNTWDGNRRPLRSLISPQVYETISTACSTGPYSFSPSSCILCLLFNQSTSVARMLSSESLYLEPHPTGPVYYFNIKLAPDVGIPEVNIEDYNNYLVQYQGAIGCFKPTYYYNWRDMLTTLQTDNMGNVSLSPLY